MSHRPDYRSSASGFFASPPAVDPATINALRRHVINLNFGQLSSSGGFTSSRQTVAEIFQEHLPRWIHHRRDEGPHRVVLYAHGGLTSEGWGLHTAAHQYRWWLENGVYPVFFVWETGLLETIWQLISGGERYLPQMQRAARAGWFDNLKDQAIEAVARRLGGRRIWAGMKQSAERTFAADDSDGRYVLRLISDLVDANDDSNQVELHGVGHSAGSIFLTHAIAAASEMRNAQQFGRFRSAHFLAPAMTCELFNQKLAGNIGADKILEKLCLFTMRDELERVDPTMGPYSQSLLYLVHEALEIDKHEPLLGLERSLRESADLAKLFKLAKPPSDKIRTTEVVFSDTSMASPYGDQPVPLTHRSESRTHGGFDNDPATMQSVIRRIKGVRFDHSVTRFPDDRGVRGANVLPRSASLFQQPDSNCDCSNPPAPTPAPGPDKNPSPPSLQGTRKALCIGIDEYQQHPLGGCVNDMRTWASALQQHDFDVDCLVNAHATREAIIKRMENLITSSRSGDSIVVQFAGHGTQVPDIDGDEAGGQFTQGFDEALVPYDYLEGRVVLDDEIGELCRQTPSGVTLTLIFDCCHSGTATRMFMNQPVALNAGERARFIDPAYFVSRKAVIGTRKAVISTRKAVIGTRDYKIGTRDYSNERYLAPGTRSAEDAYQGASEVLFTACRSDEVALESNGQGEFTRRAVAVLNQASSLSVQEFHQLIEQAFGEAPRQHPGVYCDPQKLQSELFG
ncbi:caspase family protein [Roseiconus lacunae]|uniref:caspase family protein n=1 Tax=Roseiconus lacunae TaxID=2605694 RepID=UPI0030919267|nr:caspase family protein [Stieleria sp. HD01]